MTTTHDTTTASTQKGYELREVDPRTIRDNPDNARKPKANREGLAASIRSLGVLQPPLVREEADGTLVLVAGERRKYSAIAAGLATIPVHVRHGMSAVHQVAGMLVENHDREDLTPVEFAGGIQQLAGMEGVTTKAITEMTGVKAAEVKKAVKVASSEVASAVAERHGLTLDQAVVLAEFEDDKGAVILLTQTAAQDPRAAGPTWSASSDKTATTPEAVAALTAELEAGRDQGGRAAQRLLAPRGCRLAGRADAPRGTQGGHRGPAPGMPRPRRRGGRAATTGYEVALPLPRRRGQRPHQPVPRPGDDRVGHGQERVGWNDRRAEGRAQGGDRQQQGVAAGDRGPS